MTVSPIKITLASVRQCDLDAASAKRGGPMPTIPQMHESYEQEAMRNLQHGTMVIALVCGAVFFVSLVVRAVQWAV